MSYNKQLCYNDLTKNHEGSTAWCMTPEWELYATVVTTMGTEDKFYECGTDRVRRIADLVRKVDAEFMAQLAIYARKEMHLRSVPMLLLVELANCHHGDSLVSRAVSQTVQRADEITELLMCYQWRSGREDLHRLSNQLRKGLAEAFKRFDEYQFAKYNRTDRKVTLRDALQLVHPKPENAAQAELFRKILDGKLSTPYTWETELSAAGKQTFTTAEQRDEALCETWQQLIRSGRLGYMAMLRNLVNMTNLCIDDDCVRIVCERLSDENAVRGSQLLPFRFLSAYLPLYQDQFPAVVSADYKYDYWAFDADNALSLKCNAILKQIAYLREDHSYMHKNKVSRYLAWNALGYNADIKGLPNVKLPKKHVRYRVKQRCHKKVRRQKDLLRLQKLERHLENIYKRQSAIQSSLSRQWNRIRTVYSSNRYSRWYMDLMKSQKAEWKRRDKKLALLGTDKKRFVAPFLEALEQAVRYTADHIHGFDKNTRVLLACDTSGSMLKPVSERSAVMCFHIGLLLSMMLRNRCENVVTGMFGDIWKVYDFPSDNILRNTVDMISRNGEVGYSTNGYTVIDWLIRNERVMDKVMLFTDCELWDSQHGGAQLSASWEKYKRIAPDAKLYLFDLAGYGTTPVSMKRDDVICMSGWSDKIFDALDAVENGGKAIDMIRRIVV